MIAIDCADAYFSVRTLGRAWFEYAPDQRKTAIEQAKRDLARALVRAMRENEPAYVYGYRTRDEFAVYEQALFTLLRDVQPKGGGTLVPSLQPDERREPNRTLSSGNGKWSEEALAWLGASNRVEVVLA